MTCPFDCAPNSRFKAHIKRSKRGASAKNRYKIKKPIEEKLEASVEIIEEGIKISLPLKTVSELNCCEHWTVKHKRHSEQKRVTILALKPFSNYLSVPCSIKLTRYAPRFLDKHDNLPGSLKYILDACCAVIKGDYRAGRADDDERISISYDQVKSDKYGVQIVIRNQCLQSEG